MHTLPYTPQPRVNNSSLKNTPTCTTDHHPTFPSPHRIHLSRTPKTELRGPGLTHSKAAKEKKKGRNE